MARATSPFAETSPRKYAKPSSAFLVQTKLAFSKAAAVTKSPFAGADAHPFWSVVAIVQAYAVDPFSAGPAYEVRVALDLEEPKRRERIHPGRRDPGCGRIDAIRGSKSRGRGGGATRSTNDPSARTIHVVAAASPRPVPGRSA